MNQVRAAVHVHSDWSYDGSWPLQRIAHEFGRRRYSAVLTSEHDRGFDRERWEAYRRACLEASSPSLLIVPGIEYSDASNTVHVPVWGVPFLGEGLPTSELLARVRELGGVAVLAHPSRRQAWQVFQTEWASCLLGIEVWNRKTDGWAPSRDGLKLMNANPGLQAFVGVDFHTRRQFFPLAMRLQVTGDIDEEGVVAALRDRSLRPEAFASHALNFATGPLSVLARAAERGRQPLARLVRLGLSRVS